MGGAIVVVGAPPRIVRPDCIAEETPFPGCLFRHLRRDRTFWRAVLLSMAPFVLVHLILILTLPWPVAAE